MKKKHLAESDLQCEKNVLNMSLLILDNGRILETIPNYQKYTKIILTFTHVLQYITLLLFVS